MGLGILWLINAEEKYGIDPLPILSPETGCCFVDDFVREVQTKATYIQAKAESMPFEDGYFDFMAVIMSSIMCITRIPYLVR